MCYLYNAGHRCYGRVHMTPVDTVRDREHGRKSGETRFHTILHIIPGWDGLSPGLAKH